MMSADFTVTTVEVAGIAPMQRDLVIQRVDELLRIGAAHVGRLPGIDLLLRFDLKGRTAGQIRMARSVFGFGRRRAELRLNPALFGTYAHALMDEVLPHEVAHLLVMAKGSRERAHGPRWHALCLALGGSGARTHTLPLDASRQQQRWCYRDSAGAIHWLTTTRHRRLQQGMVYRIRHSGAALTAAGWLADADSHECVQD